MTLTTQQLLILIIPFALLNLLGGLWIGWMAWGRTLKQAHAALFDRQQALRFFRSVIKSGEQWSDECERIMTANASDGWWV